VNYTGHFFGFIFNMVKALILDRDGVINTDVGYLHQIHETEFITGIFDLCRFFQDRGFIIVIITNQSGIGRGYFTEENFQKFNNWMIEEFNKRKIKIMEVFYCPHLPSDNCICRKPKPGMFNDAIRKYNIDVNKSWAIGDKDRDLEAANNSGITNTILFDNEKFKNKNNSSSTIAKFRTNSLNKICKIYDNIQ